MMIALVNQDLTTHKKKKIVVPSLGTKMLHEFNPQAQKQIEDW